MFGGEPELRDAVPDALGTVRIVVAGQQVPVNVGNGFMRSIGARSVCGLGASLS